VTVDGHVPPEHVDHVIFVYEGGGGLRRLFVQDVGAGRVTGASALVALALPGRTGGPVAVLAAHLLGGRPVEAEHPPRLPALLAARVRTLAPRVRQPAVIVDRGRGRGCGGRHRRRKDAGPLLRARSLCGRWSARGRVAPLVVGRRVPAARIGAVPPAAHPPVLRARAARHRTRRPLRRLPSVRRRGRRRRRRGRCRGGGGRSRRSGARHERPARLLGHRFYQSVALHSRQYGAVVVLALHLPMLVSLATRDVALYGRANKQSGTQTLIVW